MGRKSKLKKKTGGSLTALVPQVEIEPLSQFGAKKLILTAVQGVGASLDDEILAIMQHPDEVLTPAAKEAVVSAGELLPEVVRAIVGRFTDYAAVAEPANFPTDRQFEGFLVDIYDKIYGSILYLLQPSPDLGPREYEQLLRQNRSDLLSNFGLVDLSVHLAASALADRVKFRRSQFKRVADGLRQKELADGSDDMYADERELIDLMRVELDEIGYSPKQRQLWRSIRQGVHQLMSFYTVMNRNGHLSLGQSKQAVAAASTIYPKVISFADATLYVKTRVPELFEEVPGQEYLKGAPQREVRQDVA